MTPESRYSRAALLASNPRIAATLESFKQLSAGWAEDIDPLPAHRVLAERIVIAEGRTHHETICLQLVKVHSVDGSSDAIEVLSVNHARLWQFMSLKLFPSQPQGVMQLQMELAIILEALAPKVASTAEAPPEEAPTTWNGSSAHILLSR